MRRVYRWLVFACLGLASLPMAWLGLNRAQAQSGFQNHLAQGRRSGFSGSTSDPVKRTFTVEGQDRTALVFPSSKSTPAEGSPLVFFFHGHGGNVQKAARTYQIQALWPEAVVVYLQGLPGVEGLTDPQGEKPGWQKNPGDLNDRDVKFVDVALAETQSQYKINPKRIYAMGHSNGGRFTNVLWNVRGQEFAAFCSASGQGGRLLETCVPRSTFIIAGEQDRLVPYDNQLKTVELARKLLQTDPSKAIQKGYAGLEPGKNGLELATYLHPGGHEFPQEALPLVIAFFQKHAKP